MGGLCGETGLVNSTQLNH